MTEVFHIKESLSEIPFKDLCRFYFEEPVI